MVRLVERIKVCARCGDPKPWSDFYTKVKWPDGTTRVPQSRCKVCSNEVRATQKREQRKTDPEKWRERYARIWSAVSSDPDRHAITRSYAREWRRRRDGVTADRFRTSRHMRVECRSEFIDAEPFADHLLYLMERDDSSMLATAERLGMNDRTFRLIVHGDQATVNVSLVERVLIADDTTTLRELYPDWFEEAA